MNFSDIELHAFRKLLSTEVPQGRPEVGKLEALTTYLKKQEGLLADLVNGKISAREAGSLEHAASRYIIKSAIEELAKRKLTSESEQQNILALASSLKLEESIITREHMEKIAQPGIVGGDGTIYWFDTYEGLDTKWASALAYYAQLNRGEIKKAPFVAQSNVTGIPVTSDNVTIAILGDWGSGPYKNTDGVFPASLVMESIAKHKPDMAIHLGDVYYNGTSSSDSIYPGEEKSNLVDVWGLPSTCQSFTLNSNHEMYSGGHGLFKTALTSSIFSAQNGATYFALVHANWVIFGLDSAYYDTSPLFMDGALTDANQIDFIKGVETTGKKVIMMTHHNALEDNGTAPKGPLWGNVKSALGRNPDFWYWGHTHNAIVYSDKADVGSTIARCVGHGAIPFTKAPELYQPDGSNNPEITYYAGQELPIQPNNGQIQLAKNGYAILTITPDSLTETLYDQNGNAVWGPATYSFG